MLTDVADGTESNLDWILSSFASLAPSEGATMSEETARKFFRTN